MAKAGPFAPITAPVQREKISVAKMTDPGLELFRFYAEDNTDADKRLAQANRPRRKAKG